MLNCRSVIVEHVVYHVGTAQSIIVLNCRSVIVVQVENHVGTAQSIIVKLYECSCRTGVLNEL